MNATVDGWRGNQLTVENDRKQTLIAITNTMSLGDLRKFIGANGVQREMNFRHSGQVIPAGRCALDVLPAQCNFL